MALHFGKRETEQPKSLNTGMATQRYGQPGTSPSGAQAPTPAQPSADTATTMTSSPGDTPGQGGRTRRAQGDSPSSFARERHVVPRTGA